MPDDREYELVENLVSDGYRRMVVLALLALGHSLSCEMPQCLSVSRGRFEPTGGWRISVDHITPRCIGGSDRPENLRIAHWACNASAGMQDGKARSRTTILPPALPGTRYEDLAALQQEIVALRLGEQDPDSRWTFLDGVPTREA